MAKTMPKWPKKAPYSSLMTPITMESERISCFGNSNGGYDWLSLLQVMVPGCWPSKMRLTIAPWHESITYTFPHWKNVMSGTRRHAKMSPLLYLGYIELPDTRMRNCAPALTNSGTQYIGHSDSATPGISVPL